MDTVVKHKHFKSMKATIERVFVTKYRGESMYVTYSYNGEFKRATNFCGCNMGFNNISASDLRFYRVYESGYRLITKNTTIGFIRNRLELFKLLGDLNYNRP